MSNYSKESFDYRVTRARVTHHGPVAEPSTHQKIENLLNEIEIAQDTIMRMSTDRDIMLITEGAIKRNATAIAEIEVRIKLLYSQIDAFLQTQTAA